MYISTDTTIYYSKSIIPYYYGKKYLKKIKLFTKYDHEVEVKAFVLGDIVVLEKKPTPDWLKNFDKYKFESNANLKELYLIGMSKINSSKNELKNRVYEIAKNKIYSNQAPFYVYGDKEHKCKPEFIESIDYNIEGGIIYSGYFCHKCNRKFVDRIIYEKYKNIYKNSFKSIEHKPVGLEKFLIKIWYSTPEIYVLASSKVVFRYNSSNNKICKNCNLEMKKHIVKIYEYSTKKQLDINVFYCDSCDSIYLAELNNEIENIILNNYRFNYLDLPELHSKYLELEKRKKEEKTAKKLEIEKNRIKRLEKLQQAEDERKKFLMKLKKVNITYNDFLIINTARNHCKNHNVKDIMAILNVVTKSKHIIEVEVPAFYCETCKKYYILENSYFEVTRYGTPLAKIITYKKYKSGDFRFEILNERSKLNILGYNVNYIDELTEIQRHNILIDIVNSKLMSRNEIASFLQFLINTHTGYKNERAQMKWSNDKDFILKYNFNELVKAKVERIKIYEYE